MVLRQIPNDKLTPEQLGLTDAIIQCVMRPRGLFLVTGPTGSGKSTTLASLINYLNETVDHHIITIEDPIEFYHEHKKSTINQREIRWILLLFLMRFDERCDRIRMILVKCETWKPLRPPLLRPKPDTWCLVRCIPIVLKERSTVLSMRSRKSAGPNSNSIIHFDYWRTGPNTVTSNRWRTRCSLRDTTGDTGDRQLNS